MKPQQPPRLHDAARPEIRQRDRHAVRGEESWLRHLGGGEEGGGVLKLGLEVGVGGAVAAAPQAAVEGFEGLAQGFEDAWRRVSFCLRGMMLTVRKGADEPGCLLFSS